MTNPMLYGTLTNDVPATLVDAAKNNNGVLSPWPLHEDGSFGTRTAKLVEVSAETVQAFVLSATRHAVAGTVPESMQAALDATPRTLRDNSRVSGMTTATTAKNAHKRALTVVAGPKGGTYPVLGCWMSVLNRGNKALAAADKPERAKKSSPKPAATQTEAPAPAVGLSAENIAAIVAATIAALKE